MQDVHVHIQHIYIYIYMALAWWCQEDVFLMVVRVGWVYCVYAFSVL